MEVPPLQRGQDLIAQRGVPYVCPGQAQRGETKGGDARSGVQKKQNDAPTSHNRSSSLGSGPVPRDPCTEATAQTKEVHEAKNTDSSKETSPGPTAHRRTKRRKKPGNKVTQRGGGNEHNDEAEIRKTKYPSPTTMTRGTSPPRRPGKTRS